MNSFKIYQDYKQYIDQLVANQNNTTIEFFQDLYTRKDYQEILRPVLKVIQENPNASLNTLRNILYEKNKLNEIIYNFIHQTRIAPGLILDFGTSHYRDTVICGNAQECNFVNGKFIEDIKPLEDNSIFDLASSSKLLMAIAVMQLVENNFIDLFDPIRKYLPEYKKLEDTTVYDLLKFRTLIRTDKRVDAATNRLEAEEILRTAHIENEELTNMYTDIGAMILRQLVEKVTKIPFTEYVKFYILDEAHMKDTHLLVPEEKQNRIANENYSTIIQADGRQITKFNTFPGITYDPKSLAIGELQGIAPGHAGWFSTKNDMVNLGQALIDGKLLNKDSLMSISDTATGFIEGEKISKFFGSLVYLKQVDSKFLGVQPILSGRAFMSPGFAGTTLIVDPLNNITLFLGAQRLHNRIYQIAPSQKEHVKIDEETGKETFVFPNGEEKIVSENFAHHKEFIVAVALQLSLQYQLLEAIYKPNKEMRLVREIN